MFWANGSTCYLMIPLTSWKPCPTRIVLNVMKEKGWMAIFHQHLTLLKSRELISTKSSKLDSDGTHPGKKRPWCSKDAQELHLWKTGNPKSFASFQKIPVGWDFPYLPNHCLGWSGRFGRYKFAQADLRRYWNASKWALVLRHTNMFEWSRQFMAKLQQHDSYIRCLGMFNMQIQNKPGNCLQPYCGTIKWPFKWLSDLQLRNQKVTGLNQQLSSSSMRALHLCCVCHWPVVAPVADQQRSQQPATDAPGYNRENTPWPSLVLITKEWLHPHQKRRNRQLARNQDNFNPW